MVRITERIRDVTVFFPSRSLLGKMAEGLRQNRPYHLRLIAFRPPTQVDEAMDATDIAIIDATEHPDDARDVLVRGVVRIGPERITLYTEHSDEGLEVFARTRGVQLLLGPLTPGEWDGFFRWIRVHGKPAEGAPCHSPHLAGRQPEGKEAWQ